EFFGPLAEHVELAAELDRFLRVARRLLAFEERQLRRLRKHFGGAIDADEHTIAIGIGVAGRRLAVSRSHDRQERIAARERWQIDFRVERAVSAQKYIHARTQTH